MTKALTMENIMNSTFGEIIGAAISAEPELMEITPRSSLELYDFWLESGMSLGALTCAFINLLTAEALQDSREAK